MLLAPVVVYSTIYTFSWSWSQMWFCKTIHVPASIIGANYQRLLVIDAVMKAHPAWRSCWVGAASLRASLQYGGSSNLSFVFISFAKAVVASVNYVTGSLYSLEIQRLDCYVTCFVESWLNLQCYWAHGLLGQASMPNWGTGDYCLKPLWIGLLFLEGVVPNIVQSTKWME